MLETAWESRWLPDTICLMKVRQRMHLENYISIEDINYPKDKKINFIAKTLKRKLKNEEINRKT